MPETDAIQKAANLDNECLLRSFRDLFELPGGEEDIYFLGNSLGAMPKQARESLNFVLNQWSKEGVGSHFTPESGWLEQYGKVRSLMAPLVGALKSEVVLMNALTVNLHFLLQSFYQPDSKRFKILMEPTAFPSDVYAVKSHLESRGLDWQKSLVFFEPENKFGVLDASQMASQIEKEGEQLALVLLGQPNYLTGQVFDIKKLVEATHRTGALFGVDLAHGAGNLELKLHEWKVDFATWCTYKYLNSGPGSVAGVFIHEKHHPARNDHDLNLLQGWWSNRPSTRFEMKKNVDLADDASAWAISNPPVLYLATLAASLEIFHKAGMEKILLKQKKLTGFLVDQLLQEVKEKVEIITPEQRGSQVSLRVKGVNDATVEQIKSQGLHLDFRYPDVLRMAPAPLYNQYTEVARASQILADSLR